MAVETVLEDTRYRDRARVLADEIARMSGPDEVADLLGREALDR
jgi:UDP:flavonoid glycosyltransferase YjiC (YdhE family)